MRPYQEIIDGLIVICTEGSSIGEYRVTIRDTHPNGVPFVVEHIIEDGSPGNAMHNSVKSYRLAHPRGDVSDLENLDPDLYAVERKPSSYLEED